VGIPLAAVYRNLAAYHRSGASWPEALDGSAPGEEWREAAGAMRRGEAPSQALSHVVPALDVAGLRAAEASGRMEDALASLAVLHEQEDRRRRERRAAMTYPFLLAHLGAFLLPFPDLFAGRVGAAILWVVAALAPVYLVVFLAARARRGKGVLFTRAAIEEADARALRALGWLHQAGVPFPEALPLAAQAGAGGRVARDLERGAGEVSRGLPLAGAWRESPPEVVSQLTAAEATGTFAAALERTATTLEEEAHSRRRRLAAVLPPILVLAIGLVVAWRAISFYSGYLDRVIGR
jgi:type II secretory pathway component PulF